MADRGTTIPGGGTDRGDRAETATGIATNEETAKKTPTETETQTRRGTEIEIRIGTTEDTAHAPETSAIADARGLQGMADETIGGGAEGTPEVRGVGKTAGTVAVIATRRVTENIGESGVTKVC